MVLKQLAGIVRPLALEEASRLRIGSMKLFRRGVQPIGQIVAAARRERRVGDHGRRFVEESLRCREARLADWDPPFAVDLSRIAPRDEDYWRYTTTGANKILQTSLTYQKVSTLRHEIGFEGDIARHGATRSNHWFHENWDTDDGIWAVADGSRRICPFGAPARLRSQIDPSGANIPPTTCSAAVESCRQPSRGVHSQNSQSPPSPWATRARAFAPSCDEIISTSAIRGNSRPTS